MNKISLDELNASEECLDLDQKTMTKNLWTSAIQIYYGENNFEIPYLNFHKGCQCMTVKKIIGLFPRVAENKQRFVYEKAGVQ